MTFSYLQGLPAELDSFDSRGTKDLDPYQTATDDVGVADTSRFHVVRIGEPNLNVFET